MTSVKLHSNYGFVYHCVSVGTFVASRHSDRKEPLRRRAARNSAELCWMSH